MEKPKKVSKYLITEGRYLKDGVDTESMNARSEDPVLKKLMGTESAEDYTEWVPNQMVNLDEIRNYNPSNFKTESGFATKIVFNNGDTEIIRLTAPELLEKLIQREDFLYEYNLYLGEVKLGKNKN